jgi:hypothetical protein
VGERFPAELIFYYSGLVGCRHIGINLTEKFQMRQGIKFENQFPLDPAPAWRDNAGFYEKVFAQFFISFT